MILKKKNIFPFHIFLVPVFFVWHTLNNYFGLIPFHYVEKFLLWHLPLPAVLFMIGRWITGDRVKAGCWVTPLLIIFFFWYPLFHFLKSFYLPAFFTSYSFLLITLLALAIFFLWFLKKKKTVPFKLNDFFLLVFIIFLVAEAGKSLYKFASGQLQKNSFSYQNKSLPLNIKPLDNSEKPDIFFIIFDSYASSLSLKKYLGYNNSQLDSCLTSQQFFIATRGKSNYNATPYSLASTLDADYLNFSFNNFKGTANDLLRSQYTVKKSRLPTLFKQMGYTIKNYGRFDLDEAPGPFAPYFDYEAEEALYNPTLWVQLKLSLGWVIRKEFGNPADATPTPRTFQPTSMNIYNMEMLVTELKNQTSIPKFVLGHIMAPHNPYFFNSKGQLRSVSRSDENKNIRDSLYLDQLEYINTWVDSLARLANQPFQRPRIVIIEGDHGRRDPLAQSTFVYEKKFMNLNSYYFSDHNYSILYDSISPVNSFRVIFNKYFQTDLPLLKDSTILLH